MIWVVILYLAGLVLVLAEFLIPGMIAGVVGACLIIASAIVAIRDVPEYAFFTILAELVGVALGVVLGMWLMSRSRLGRRLVLETSQNASAGYVAADSDETLQGAQGQVLTALRPAGTITVGGRRVDAVSDGTFIDAGERVRVIEVNGSRVVVERVGGGNAG